MDLTLLLGFLRAVLGVVSNNAMLPSRKEQTLNYLNVVGQIVQANGNVNEALKLITDRIQSNESIADEEFADLQKRSDEAHKQIQEEDPSIKGV